MNEQSAHSPRGISLHIGVGIVDPAAYNGRWEGPLESAEKDVDIMQAIANKQGFETRVLKTRDATREKVRQAISHASSELGPGDFFLVTYSGHGDRVPDLSGDEEDGLDDTWCLHDGHFLDDELNVLLAGFQPGCRVLILSDSCHSGTMLKSKKTDKENAERITDEFVYSRATPASVSEETFESHRDRYAKLQLGLPRPRPEIGATVRLLSGCQEDEQSWGSSESGRFTAAVRDVFDEGAFEGNYKQFHAQVIKAVAKAMHPQTPGHSVVGEVSHSFDDERPFRI
jgi:metacaspase-1